MEKRLTKKDYFEMIKKVCVENPDIVAFCNHEIELLARKNSKGGSTKVQKENLVIADMLVQELEKLGTPTTITDLMNSSEVVKNYVTEEGKPLSNQKISALLNKLVKSEKLVKVIDKKKSYFSVGE